jgi:hypothetical protein
MRATTRMQLITIGTALLLGAAVGCGTPATTTGEPPLGTSEFVSAAGQAGQQSQGGSLDGAAEDPSAAADEGSKNDGRTVEEGDIYRVLAPNRLLNLNSYRGLQVIDMTDVSAPQVMGRVAVSGYPVEMYVVDQRAFVLLNNWYGYYGARNDVAVEPFEGGLVLAVDLSDPAHPTITGRARVPGYIQASRLTRGGGQEALFVAASNWNGESQTVVRSFSVSGAGRLEERTTLDLGGYVLDIQATPAALLVARYTWDQYDYSGTEVSIIDISDPNGTMVEGASIPAAGWIKNKTNMDLRGNVLRISSGGRWTGAGANYIQTFNVADIQNPVPVAQVSFAANEDLYASLFLEDRAFCVTYRQVDPFHAFAIDAEGHVTPKTEYVISGWNDYFVPVLGQSRIIGIGMDDTAGRAMAASLYDISNLDNPSPFIARAAVELDYSWSEAQWDDRAFSVLEDAVEVAAPDGTPETGLILLPFNGYNSASSQYVAAVQIFTFSATTLTRRGVMEHGTQVRRTFMAGNVTANLSERQLSLYDAQDPDAPSLLGKLDLAPNYQDFFVFGSYGARLKYDRDFYSWWGSSAALPDNQLQIIPLGGDPDNATPVATVDLPADAQLYQVGDLAVAVSTTYVANSDPAQYTSTIRVFDLSDPTAPQERGTLTTDRIQPSYGYWYGPWEDCWDCGRYYPYYYGGLDAKVAGQALVFPQQNWQSEVIGMEHSCWTYPTDESDCWTNGYQEGCTYYSGGINCTSLDGGPEHCSGQIQRCTLGAEQQWSCEKVEPGSVTTDRNCYDYERTRYWSNLTLAAVDLSDPAQPTMAPDVTMPAQEDDSGVIAAGTGLYVTYRVPITIPGDPREYVRYYFKKIDFADPQAPAIGAGINIPGELMLVDGNTIYTRDFVWGETIVESALNRLQVIGNHAYLQARRRFVDQEVQSLLLDGAGHALVAHNLSWYAAGGGYGSSAAGTKLSILDLAGSGFPLLSQTAVDSWATLREAHAGRALFSVPGGVLVMNVQNATAPYAQAYFALQGWPTRFVLGADDLYIPAGPYGMYRFDLDAYNLLEDN